MSMTFLIRKNLHTISLIESFKLSKEKFETLFNGSAILRLGYERWLRNIAIGLGNAKKSKEILYYLIKDYQIPLQWLKNILIGL